MTQENRINRDLMFKKCFMFFANHILKIGEKDIINRLLKKYSIDEISKILDMEKATLISLLDK